jgi:hypothetical protein
MLQAGVIRALAAGIAAVIGLAGCGGGGPIEENVVRPGITAIEQASAFACNSDAEVLRTAIEVYTELQGDPPVDEAALVAAGYVRQDSTLYDVVNGQVVPVAVDCGGTGAPARTPTGSPPMTAPAADLGEIVTSTEPSLTPQQMVAQFTPEEVAEVGGPECAGELASLFVAAQNYAAEQGKDPETIEALAGYLDQAIDMWVVEAGNLGPAPGSTCTDINDASDEQAQSCELVAKTLQVAREAYIAQMGDGSEPTQQQLVDIGYLRSVDPTVDLVDGVIAAVPGGPCDGVDLGL